MLCLRSQDVAICGLSVKGNSLVGVWQVGVVVVVGGMRSSMGGKWVGGSCVGCSCNGNSMDVEIVVCGRGLGRSAMRKSLLSRNNGLKTSRRFSREKSTRS